MAEHVADVVRKRLMTLITKRDRRSLISRRYKVMNSSIVLVVSFNLICQSVVVLREREFMLLLKYKAFSILIVSGAYLVIVSQRVKPFNQTGRMGNTICEAHETVLREGIKLERTALSACLLLTSL